MNINKPYFQTWSAQSSDSNLDVASARDDEFILADGTAIYDFLSTSFQTNFGHSNSLIKERIKQQLDVMAIASPKANFELKQRASARLIELLGFDHGRLFYTVSGAESVENALKIARQVKNRKKIMARQNSYHGASLGALSVTGDWRNLPHFTCDKETVRIPEPHEDPDCERLKRLMLEHRDSVAGLILETITGANGVIIPSARWFQCVQDLCKEYDVFLIMDEVLCGFGRTGRPFAFQHYDSMNPDLICMSKGISGGYIPFGALWTSQNIADFYGERVFSCGLTSYAHPLGLAAMDAVLDLLGDPGFQKNLRSIEHLFSERLQKLESLLMVKEIRCQGMLAAIDFDCEAPTWDMGIRSGLHLFSKGNMNVLAPPLTTTPENLNKAFDRYAELLNSFKM